MGLKPKEQFSVIERDGVLYVMMSKATRIYYLAIVTGFELLNLLSLGLFIVITGRLTKFQWVGVACLGIIGLISYCVYLLLMLPQKPYVFDRSKDRFMHGNKLVSRITNIKHLQVQRQPMRGGKLSCA